MGLDVLIVGLATLGILRAWFKGSLFARKLAKYQALRDQGSRAGELLSCPLCLSYHVAFWFNLLFMVPQHLVQGSCWLDVLMVALSVLPVTFASAVIAQRCYDWWHPEG